MTSKIQLLIIFFCFLYLHPCYASVSRDQAINDTLASTQLKLYAEANPGELTKQSPAATDTKKTKEDRDAAISKAFYVSIAYDYNRMHYSEWDGDDKWTENYGNHGGMYYALGYKSPNTYRLIGNPFAEAYYRQFANMIHYKGAIDTGGTSEPYDADQRSKIKQWGLKLGSWGKTSEKTDIYAYLDTGRRVWNRGEDGDIDYHEKFSWYYSGLGVGFNHRFIPNFSTGLEAEAMLGWDARVHRNDLDATYRLGTVYGFEFKLPLKYYLLKNLSLDLTPYLIFWNVDASNVVDETQKRDNFTHLEGFLAGLTYSF